MTVLNEHITMRVISLMNEWADPKRGVSGARIDMPLSEWTRVQRKFSRGHKIFRITVTTSEETIWDLSYVQTLRTSVAVGWGTSEDLVQVQVECSMVRLVRVGSSGVDWTRKKPEVDPLFGDLKMWGEK